MEIHHFFAGILQVFSTQNYKKQHKTTKSERKKAGKHTPPQGVKKAVENINV